MQHVVAERKSCELFAPNFQIRVMPYGAQRHHHFDVFQQL